MATVFSQLYQKFNQLRGRRVFILPTRWGILYAAFLLLILLAAINYSNSLGHILCFLLTSMGLLAMLYTYRNLAKIELINAYAEPVFCGQAIQFKLIFDNPNHNPCYQISVASKQDTIRSWNPIKNLTGYHYQSHSTINSLKPQQHTTHTIAITSVHRGRQKLGRIKIAGQFPVGLFDTWSYFTHNSTALVYPKPGGDLPLPLASEQGQQQTGQQQKGLDDFSGFNNYRAGDPIHAIAWKAMARDNVLRTKQFTSAVSGHIMLSWQATQQIAKLEERLSQLCLWILQAESSGVSYGLNLPSTIIDFDQGHHHQQRCLMALALYDL